MPLPPFLGRTTLPSRMIRARIRKPPGSEGRLRLPFSQLCLEIVRNAGSLPEHANQAMAAGSLEREIEGEGGQEEDDETDAEANCRVRERVAEKIPKPNPPSRPRQRTRGTVAEKANDARPGRTGQSAGDRVQLRQEPSGNLECSYVSAEDMLSATDQHTGSQREPAQNLQRPRPAPPAKAVPRQVARERRPDRDANDHGHTQVAIPRQRARADQGGDDGHRDPGLIAEDPGKQKPSRVLQNHGRHLSK